MLISAGRKTHLCFKRVCAWTALANDKPLGWEDSLLVVWVSFGCCEEQRAGLDPDGLLLTRDTLHRALTTSAPAGLRPLVLLGTIQSGPE